MNDKHRIENERQILKSISEGDAHAFRTLYIHYYNRLFQFAMTFLHSEPASEDVVEDVFFNLWKDKHTLANIPNFHAYIYSSTRYGCLNVLKSGYVSKREDVSESELQVSVSPDNPLDELTYNELCGAIRQAVISLPEKRRIIFKMAKEDELSHREIAEILQIQVCTVERQLLLAKDIIKKAIAPFLEKI